MFSSEEKEIKLILNELNINDIEKIYFNSNLDNGFKVGINVRANILPITIYQILDFFLKEELWEIKLTNFERDIIRDKNNLLYLYREIFKEIKFNIENNTYRNIDEEEFLKSSNVYGETIFFILDNDNNEKMFSKDNIVFHLNYESMIYNEEHKIVYNFIVNYIKELFNNLFFNTYMQILENKIEILNMEKEKEKQELMNKLFRNNLIEQNIINKTIL